MNFSRSSSRAVAGVLAVLGLPSYASANIGYPMIVLTFPAMVLALLPIIALEAWFFVRDLGLTKVKAFKIIGVANLVSTVVGIPISWFLVLLAQEIVDSVVHPRRVKVPTAVMGLLTPAWIPGYREIPPSIVAAATFALLAPFCIASCVVEYEVIWRWFIKRPHEWNLTFERIRSATIRANVASYAALAIVTGVWWICVL